jgi:nitroreductase
MTSFDLDQTDRLLTTTKAVRRRLDLTRPVERELVVECIRLACHAPNRSNGQRWKWYVVDDRELCRQIGEEYRRVIVPPVTTLRDQKLARGDKPGVRISESILYLADKMGEVPMLVIPCHDTQGEVPANRAEQAALYGSIYPAVWSFQLALRSRGLGSAFTTAHLLDDNRIAELLGIPSTYLQTSLIPVAHTTGGDFQPSPRLPVEGLIQWNGPSSA